ncbi:endonuclease/exonuclease/phosphatase family protein [Fulvivirga maritima]|uniref:endonuclease/exonuclease/phosphatase family protein n=1 Tax=Fulvivirga maritima TaxID=2904247 RepID=UPI001F423A7D|nr:endonuclease/exonuclease/phosphatase family protein [Fulvivirga maritima]UII26468.1 endonuclease/exonuclease/phosphatase family protein [Fulvivirga maritima]
MLTTIIIVLSVITIIGTFIKLLKEDAWWIRFFDFPQAQLAVLGMLCLVGLILELDFNIWWHFVLTLVLTAATVYESIIVFPYTWLANKESKRINDVSDECTLSLMISNVYMYNREYQRLVKVVKDTMPDVLIMVETDLKWEHGVKEIEEFYPYTIKYPIDNTYGILMYSKLQLQGSEVKFMVEEDIPSIHTYVKLRSGDLIKLYAIHPEPPSPTENERSTERDAELYLVAKEVEQVEGPVIVAGDLNDVAWSHSTRIFQRISRLLDPRKGRGFFNTFNAKIPILRWPLDHVFHSTDFRLVDIQRLPAIGSDHFPMYIRLAYSPDRPNDEPLEDPAEEDEREEAREKIRAAL